jgi:hypothetical protein
MEMNVIIGKDDFFRIPFPLVIGDRFFHVYNEGSVFKLDIFRWDESAKQPVYEVIADQPQTSNLETNPTGIVSFSQPTAGKFLYKFRPKPGVSRVAGKVPTDVKIDAEISNHDIKVSGSGVKSHRLSWYKLQGCAIGMYVGVDGSFHMGLRNLPDGMVLIREK